MKQNMEKTIITVVGKDAVGIIAKVCTYLAGNQVNVEDISQTIVQGYFNMMMIVDTSGSTKPYAEMATELEDLGDEIGVKIRCQRKIFLQKCTGSEGFYDHHSRGKRDEQDDRAGEARCENHHARHHLLDCCDSDLDALNRNIYDKITRWQRTSSQPEGD
jgi:ACT domain-containing protein